MMAGLVWRLSPRAPGKKTRSLLQTAHRHLLLRETVSQLAWYCPYALVFNLDTFGITTIYI